MTTLYKTIVESPVGPLTLVASENGLRAVMWLQDTAAAGARVPLGPVDGGENDPAGVLAAAAAQLTEYFAGTRTNFDVPLDAVGSEFQRSAWQVLRGIPFGETVSYGEQARRMGDARKARAVGAANGRNPVSIIVPCHRVVGADGSLTGFAGGVQTKAWLLDHERRVWAGSERELNPLPAGRRIRPGSWLVRVARGADVLRPAPVPCAPCAVP